MKRSKVLTSEVEAASCQLMDEAESGRNLAQAPSSLVGDVLDSAPLNFPGRALIRWRTLEGMLQERSLSVVKGLSLERGDLVLLHRPDNWPEWLVTHVVEGRGEPSLPKDSTAGAADKTKLDLKINGKRIEIEGQDEVILRCGEASITLRRNGRVVVRGAYVETRSKGTNRIKGGVVLIN